MGFRNPRILKINQRETIEWSKMGVCDKESSTINNETKIIRERKNRDKLISEMHEIASVNDFHKLRY